MNDYETIYTEARAAEGGSEMGANRHAAGLAAVIVAAKAEALEEVAEDWAVNPDSWGDNEKDYRNKIRVRAAEISAVSEVSRPTTEVISTEIETPESSRLEGRNTYIYSEWYMQ